MRNKTEWIVPAHIEEMFNEWADMSHLIELYTKQPDRLEEVLELKKRQRVLRKEAWDASVKLYPELAKILDRLEFNYRLQKIIIKTNNEGK